MESLNDPVPPATLDLLRKLGCSYRLVCFFPGPDVPASTWPLELRPPPGFHFDGGRHSCFLNGWADVEEVLTSSLIVACDAGCPPAKDEARPRGAPPLSTRPKAPKARRPKA